MNNPLNTNIFQSSSSSFSSTTPKKSHTNLLMNMMAASGNSSDHRQLFQDDHHHIMFNNNNNMNGFKGIMENIPRSTKSTIINYSTARDDDDEDNDDNNNKADGGGGGGGGGGGEAVTIAAASKKKGENKKCRKPKHAFQTRSQVDILDDGYRWRKYGQKAVKNNKFPRSYYRCTHQGCNVKKQIQRLSKDEGVVVTTYEGVHSHPIDKSTDNFEHILTQMQIYTSY